MDQQLGLAALVAAVLVLSPTAAPRAEAAAAGRDGLEITVESHMLDGKMSLLCRDRPEGEGGAYDIGISLDAEAFSVTASLAPARQVWCKWAYQGNYMKGVVLYDERWPEAAACRRGNGGCTVAFEAEVVSIVTARGASRVLGDVAVKRCVGNGWLRMFRSKCAYPPHKHRYVGQVLHSWLQFFVA